jgi:hypothetical protein
MKAVENVEAHIADAVKKGAKVVISGKRAAQGGSFLRLRSGHNLRVGSPPMLNPSVQGVIRSRHTIRIFYGVTAVALAVTIMALVILANFFGLDWLHEAAVSVLGHVAATLVVLMVVYGVWIWATPRELRNARVLALRGGEIPEFMGDLVSGASEYWFMGRSGGYFRAEVLPRLDKEARETRRAARIRIVLPNPYSGDNAVAYASMLNTLNEDADEMTLPAAVIATILEAARRAIENPYLEVEIGIAPSLPVMRLDVSNNGSLVTRDAKALPGIFCGPGNPYFDMFKSVVDNELRQSKRITWKGKINLGELINAADLAATFDGLPTINDEVLSRAKHMIAHPGHRYG